MSRCQDCSKSMKTAKTCDYPIIKIQNMFYYRNTVYHDVNTRCHDCAIINGGVHHFGCDMERCPRCGGQAFCCGCHDIDGDSAEEVLVFKNPFKSDDGKTYWLIGPPNTKPVQISSLRKIHKHINVDNEGNVVI